MLGMVFLAFIEMSFYGWMLGCMGVAYLCGSIPFGYLAGKMKGIDIREHGSGNIGATNAVRVLGKAIGLPVFFLDFLKGFLPVWGAQWVLSSYCEGWSGGMVATVLVLTAMAGVLGHTFTCWLGFKGGKGVATAGGVLMGLFWLPASIVVGTWALVFVVTRYVSIASMAAAAVFPVTVLWRYGYLSGEIESGSIPYLVFSIVVSALVILKHVSNIKRLLTGTEPRCFSGKKLEK